MKRLTSAAVAFLVLGGTAAGGGGDAKREMKLLEGTWKVTAAEVSGKRVGLEKLGVDQIVFAGGRVLWKNQGKEVANFAYSVDPGRTPKEMNLLKEKERQTLPSIYALDGDELKWCLPMASATEKVRLRRPESFETKDAPLILLTGKREQASRRADRGREKIIGRVALFTTPAAVGIVVPDGHEECAFLAGPEVFREEPNPCSPTMPSFPGRSAWACFWACGASSGRASARPRGPRGGASVCSLSPFWPLAPPPSWPR